MAQTLTEFINFRTNNKFSFLKLREVVLKKDANKCIVSFIYPQSIQNVADDDKKIIEDLCIEFLNIPIKVEVWIVKSFLDEYLILKFVENYFKSNHKSISDKVSSSDVDVKTSGEIDVNLNFKIDKNTLDFIEKNKIFEQFVKSFGKNFCANLKIDFEIIENDASSEFLEKRIKDLERESSMKALLTPKKQRFLVEDRRLLFGKEININPEYIANIKNEGIGIVVCGNIKFLNEKTYKTKRTAKDFEGNDIQLEKPYFSFVLQDKSGSINCVLFPSKANYHKMQLLRVGNLILVRGDVKKFNDKIDMSVKDISFCSLSDNVKIADAKTVLNSPYMFVLPKPFVKTTQSNLFEEKSVANAKVLDKEYVVYDFETTGLDPTKEDIIEIGAAKIVNGEIKEVFSTLVKPSKVISYEITKLTGIDNDMVKFSYSIEQVILDFYKFCKDCVLVGYNNVDFDSKFLNAAAKKVGLEFSNQQLDAFLIAKQKIKGLSRYTLSSVSNALGVNLKDAHRALGDVMATAEVFLKLY